MNITLDSNFVLYLVVGLIAYFNLSLLWGAFRNRLLRLGESSMINKLILIANKNEPFVINNGRNQITLIKIKTPKKKKDKNKKKH